MITLLSNITIESLATHAAKITGEEVYTSPGYNTWQQDLITQSFGKNDTKGLFLILDAKELIGEMSLSDWDSIKIMLDGALSVIISFTKSTSNTPLFVSTLDMPQRQIKPILSKRIESMIMSYWRESLENNNVPIIELSEISANIGRENFYSSKMWYLGSLPYSMTGEKALAEEIDRVWRAYKGKKAKCLILDLDNTLWGGVIGEDGVGGIILSSTKEGSRYRDFQKRIKDLKELGIILAVVSKNNPEDAINAIENHPAMVLRKYDFISIKANWEPKSINIDNLAKELNLGLSSFVFIDDNPVEREAVKLALPEVLVPEFPKDTSLLEQFAINVANEYFPTLKLTSEDMHKTEQYKIEARRNELKASSATLEDYLASLEMQLTIRLINEDDVVRAAQLTQKTNQFNLTTRRYTEDDIRRMMQSDKCMVYLGELQDKFGDYGKVVLCIIKLENEKAYIDTFLMSCRVMGRNVENDFLKHIETTLTDKGIREIYGEYITTAKNSVVKDFFDKVGYTLIEQNPLKNSVLYKKY